MSAISKTTTNAQTPLKILLTGLVPTSSDVPQWALDLYGSAAEIEAKIKADTERLRAAGHDITLYYFDDTDPQTGLDWLTAKLRTEIFQGIQVGSGLRLLQSHMILFENVVNICHKLAPKSVLIFNDGPGTSWDAVTRNEEKLKEVKIQA